jgi:nitroreductase
MMDPLEAIGSRRAVRTFADRAVPRAEIDRILEAGRRAPSSMNEQRWDFILCLDRGHLRELATVGDYAGHLAGAAFAVALVTPDVSRDWERESIAFDLGQCAENMLVAAWALGIGAVHASVYDEAMARGLLGYPEGKRCDTLLSFGYPADPTIFERPPLARRSLGDVVHEERW